VISWTCLGDSALSKTRSQPECVWSQETAESIGDIGGAAGPGVPQGGSRSQATGSIQPVSEFTSAAAWAGPQVPGW
jgi:hypothetical protein